MIARTWRGWADGAGAAGYELHFRSSVLTELASLEGFMRAALLRREQNGEVELLVITWFASMDAVRRFAGPDPARAVVQEEARRLLLRYDETVTHYEVPVSTS